MHSEKKKKTTKKNVGIVMLSAALASVQPFSVEHWSLHRQTWDQHGRAARPFWAVIYHTGSFQLSPFVSDHRDLWAFVSNLIWVVNVNAGGTRFRKALCGESEQGPVRPTNGQMLFKSPSSSGQVPQSKRNLMGIISSADKQYITRRKEIK